jgi:transposase InsO family protein
MRRLYHERLEKKSFKMSIVLMLRDLEPRERARTIAELTAKEFSIPYSDKTTISRTTIYEWLWEYRHTKDCETVLLDKERSDRELFRRLTDIQKNSLMVWRSGNKYRTIEQLREELMAHGETCSGYIPSESTISRFLKSVGLDRQTLLKAGPPGEKVRLSYEAPYPQRLWLADTKGPNLHVKDPDNPEKICVAVPVVFIDDNSRYLPSFKYIYKDEEDEDTIMRMFMGAIYLFGVPDILYLDRGGPYMGHRLKRSAELLGCRVMHTGVRDAPAKGKAEKMMRYFYERLECELMTKPGPMTIEEANMYVTALVCQDYHRAEHSSTGQTPEERFFAYPAEYRRFVSKKALSKIFLPYTKSRVSKTGLIHINKLEYLVPDCSLYGKYVEVRWDACDTSMIYVWYEDRFIGEAYLYHTENDFVKRQQLEESMVKRPALLLPDPAGVPLYGYLERKLAAHRMEAENVSINDGLEELKVKRAKVKAELTRLPQKAMGQDSTIDTAGEFTADRLVHLLSVLLRRMLSAHERLAVHMTWQKYGPFDEAQARKTVGTLLGENHPVSELTGYLDALRIAAMASAK